MRKIAEIIMDGIRKTMEEEKETVEIPMAVAIKLIYVLPKLDDLMKEIKRVEGICREESR